jgi:hypothetical protein
LSRQFSWTPDQIRWLTLQELEIYTAGNQEYRKHIDPIELSLEKIRRALYSFFGMKEADKGVELEKKIDRVSMGKVTKDAKDAWIEAGMPSPAGPWLKNYRNQDHG